MFAKKAKNTLNGNGMELGYRVLGIIPARGGSKGIPRKNVRLLAGRPLLAYTVDAAQTSLWLTKSIVTTDDLDVKRIATSLGCETLVRPPNLAADDTPMLPVIIHTIEALQSRNERYDIVVLLQPVAPLRTGSDIDACLELLVESGADSVVSVCEVPRHYHPEWQLVFTDNGLLTPYNGKPLSTLAPARQLLSPTFVRNGAVYAVWTDFLVKNQQLLGPDTRAYVMPEIRSVNIDSEMDLLLAELVLTQQGKQSLL